MQKTTFFGYSFLLAWVFELVGVRATVEKFVVARLLVARWLLARDFVPVCGWWSRAKNSDDLIGSGQVLNINSIVKTCSTAL